MSRLPLRPCATVLAGLLLAAGCRTTPLPDGSGTLWRSGDAEMARRVKAQAHFAAGVVHQLNEDNAAAFEEYYLAAKANPQDEELLLDVSNRFIEGRQFEKALEVLTWAAALPQPPNVVFLRLGFVHAQLGQMTKAIEANRMAVRRMPHFLPARQNLYFSYVQAKQPDAALKLLDESAARPDADAEFLLSLSELYINHGRQFPEKTAQVRGQALELLNRVARQSPLDIPLQLKLADGLHLLGDTKGAAKAYLELLDFGDPSPPLRDIMRAKLVDIFLRDNDFTRATEQLNSLLLDNPGNASAHYFLGSIAMEQRRWTEAIESFQRALRANPGFEQAHYDLATALLATGRAPEAAQSLEAARAAFPNRFGAEYLLGIAYHEQKQYAEALQHLEAAEAIAQARETNRLTSGLYFQLGATSERARDYPKAEQCFERAIALSPDNDAALNYLGYMWAERGQNLERAKELIERALKIEPNSAAYLDSLGWVYFQMGKPREAVEYLLKAVAAAPDEPDATIYDHLGDAYAALNEMDKAREAWAKSLSVEASDAVKKKLDDSKLP